MVPLIAFAVREGLFSGIECDLRAGVVSSWWEKALTHFDEARTYNGEETSQQREAEARVEILFFST